MHKSEINADPDLRIPQIPVICDRCRETGIMGEGPFSALPDILDFTPVQRRAHVNGWKEEHQRAFIAALAITGSPRQAARAIGRHQFGADQLKNHRTGKGFAAAWEAAMELAREREIHRIHDNLASLAQQRDTELSSISPPSKGGAGGGYDGSLRTRPECPYDADLHADDYPEYWESKRAIRERLTNARRWMLFLISEDDDKRRAWETLVGPVDWERAMRMQRQDDEPFFDPDCPESGSPNMRNPDMLITAEAGLLAEMTGGHDLMAEIREQVAAAEAAHAEGLD